VYPIFDAVPIKPCEKTTRGRLKRIVLSGQTSIVDSSDHVKSTWKRSRIVCLQSFCDMCQTLFAASRVKTGRRVSSVLSTTTSGEAVSRRLYDFSPGRRKQSQFHEEAGTGLFVRYVRIVPFPKNSSVESVRSEGRPRTDRVAHASTGTWGTQLPSTHHIAIRVRPVGICATALAITFSTFSRASKPVRSTRIRPMVSSNTNLSSLPLIQHHVSSSPLIDQE
jgi:hypothetical protein